MGEVITPGKSIGASDFRYLTGEHRELHYLRKPNNYGSSLAWGNLAYQMQYSVESLETELAEAGMPHILQINLDWKDGDWQNPSGWRLYADGAEVAAGNGEFARQCFEESAEKFKDTCHQAIKAAGVAALEPDTYRILKYVRAIAAAEPYDNGSPSMGGKAHRVY